jgi:hypothetical protein
MGQHTHANIERTTASGIGVALLFVAAVIGILMIAIYYPTSEGRVGDTNNAGPSVKTVTPTPMPPASPTTPKPTTEPR